MKPLFRVVMLFVVCVTARPLHAEHIVRCESRDERYQLCGIPPHSRVNLVRELSDKPCLNGESWGITNAGIWVDRGCRAEFAVDTWQYAGGDLGVAHQNQRILEQRQRSVEDTSILTSSVAAIAAAAAGRGAGIPFPALPPQPLFVDESPTWATGVFVGHSQILGREVRLEIFRDGRAESIVGGIHTRGKLLDGRLEMENGKVYRIHRDGDGFRSIEIRNPDNNVHFRPRL